MKKLCLFSLLCLPFLLLNLQAQSNIYSQSINQPALNLRGGAITLGSVNATFPSDGYVVVHFDGECYASVGDLIVVAASNNGDWQSNDGNISIETSKAGFGRPFSHTRVYPVTAGAHTYAAVAQNYVETDGNGIASIYGTLTVEYFPEGGTSTVKASGFIFNGNVTNTTVVGQQTIHANAAGKMLVRFDGFITSDPGDRIVLAASNTMNWSFNDGNVAVEAVNEGDVDENSFSHTRVYNVPSAGDYTYYALAQQYGEAGGNGNIWAYGNLLVEFYPTTGPEKILSSGFTLPTIDLNGNSTTLTSLSLTAPEAGKVMVTLDGYLTANEGYDIVLAASNNGDWTAADGNITLQALDNDQNRYSFSHTRVYTINAGVNTFYGVGQIFGGSGSETADLFGQLTVKYFPASATATNEITATKNTFDLYPNPAKDEIHLSFKNSGDPVKDIQLLDLNGHTLKEFRDNGKEEMNIDISTFPVNVYWVKVGESVKRVVKM
ncbi:MAG: T9SS type A sorting domain-containing protein [Saprospiraceae bacterium]|uniref:T9SS type A sorting domain-containing protein n=1 Tax=Candidatus Opimibacter skivensis TaxID=2982028 RepID=A0A9D7XQ23_9BACT|nr:T9SS type A sorting domain-containing protein [Candidatus Opimibacter skivensis]